MAISPINVSRVSQNMRASFAVASLQHNQLQLFNAQVRIATGRSFVTPSENPSAAVRVLDLTQAVQRQAQFLSTLRFSDNVLLAADDAVSEVNSLLIEAQSLASKNVSNLISAEERSADAELIAGIRQQLQSVGNRQFDGRFIFAGRDTTSRPFIEALGGIAYTGDTGDLLTRIGEGNQAVINMPGNVLFGALSGRIATGADLSPALSETVRLDDIGGAIGRGITTGTLVIEDSIAGTFSVDLSSADTIGDVAALINSAASDAGSGLTAELSDSGIDIFTGGAAVSVTDSSGGAVASDLGILTLSATSDDITGLDVRARLTRLTTVDALAAGDGIDLDAGLIITNGPLTVTVDLSTAETVQDIINSINNAGVFVLARVNEAGTGIDLFNKVSGTSLTIGENGGTTAADLGFRTYDSATLLDDLNFGLGVTRIAGQADLRITAKDGSTFDVDLDTARTVGDVVELINEAATEEGVSVTADLATVGNGITLSDQSGGTGDLSTSMVNQSAAAADLGLLKSSQGTETELVADDRNAMRTDGILSALFELESALRLDDTQGIVQAAARMDSLSTEVTRNHGIIGARSQAMRAKLYQMESAAANTEVLLSEVRDLDYAAAVTEMQLASSQLQVSMQANSRLLDLSLMNFLR